MPSSFHRAALESMLAKVLYLATRLALPPMVLSQVGLAKYGLWSIAFVLVTYLGLSVSGLATVYVREIARAHQQDDATYASGILSTGVALALVLGGGFCLVLALSLNSLLGYFSVEPALIPLASQVIMVTTLVFLADLSLGAWGYVLHALNRVHEQQRIWVASFLLEWLLVAVFLALHWGIHALLWAFVLRYALSIPLSWWRVRCVWPALRLHPRCIQRRYLSPFLQLGLKSQASDMWAMVLHSADRILAGLSFGNAATALLDLGGKLPSTATSIASGISLAVLPQAACLDKRAMQALYQQALRMSLFCMLLLMPMLVAVAPALSLGWLGSNVQLDMITQIMLWTTPAWHMHVLTGCASSALRGQGHLRFEMGYHLLRTLTLAMSFIWAQTLLQFVLAYAIGSTLVAFLYLVIASLQLQLAAHQLLRWVLVPFVFSYALAFGFAYFWPWHLLSRSGALLEVISAASVFFLLLALPVWHGFLLQKERSWLCTQLAGVFKKRETYHV